MGGLGKLSRMNSKRWLSWALATTVLSGLGPPAKAQGSERKGLFVGGSVGLGNSSPDLCFQCDTGLAVGGHVGAMLKPRLGVLAQFGVVASSPTVPSDIVGRHQGFLAAVQYWPSRRVWLKAGAGAGVVQRSHPAFRQEHSTTHFAGLAGIGLEINPRSSVVVELALSDLLSGDSPATVSEPKAVNSVIFNVGVTWYRR